MNARKLHKLKNEMQAFVEDVAAGIGRSERKHWCSTYLRGLLLDGERKSIEPMASRLTAIDRPEKDYVQRSSSSSTRATGKTRLFARTCGDASAAPSAMRAC